MKVADANICWLMLRDDRSKAYLLRAQRNLPDSWAKKMNQPVDDGISSLVALSGESLVMNGVPMQKLKVSALGRSIGVIPIKIQGEVIGLLIVVRKADIEITRDAQTLLEAMADYASISLVNARLFHALEKTAETARTGESFRYATLESVRTAIRNEVQVASYPLNFVLTETPGPLNPEQRQALESVQVALQRLSRSSEKTVIPNQINEKQ
jgi:K+-sensing histidine kinase KdpD